MVRVQSRVEILRIEKEPSFREISPIINSGINISSKENSDTFGHSGLVSCVGLGSFEQNISIEILNNLL